MYTLAKKLAAVVAKVPQRYVITLLGFTVTVIASTMKYAAGLALTEMVVPTGTAASSSGTITAPLDPHSCPYPDSSIVAHNTTSYKEGERFEWSETTQGLIFGALFWTYMSLQVPFGLLVESVGPRRVLGGGVALSALSCLLTPPLVTSLGAPGFIVARVFTGAGLASIYPCLNLLLAKWAPPCEKSKLGAIIYAGENVGFIVSMGVSGLLLAHGSWPVLFYVYGGAGLVWLALWQWVGHDSPQSHPCISQKEKDYLQACVSNTQLKLAPTPWLSMARSLPLWGTVVAQVGHDWGIITLVTSLPRYMKTVLHYEIEQNGLLTAIPYAAMTVVAVLSGWLSDWLLHRQCLSITAARKLFTAIAAVGPSLGVLAALSAGCSRPLSLTGFSLGLALMGFYYPSLAVNTLDLSPHYSGTLMGFIALGGLAGIFSPYLSGLLAPQGTMSEWRLVFSVAVLALVVSHTFYLMVASGEVQPWDKQPQEQDSTTQPQEEKQRRQTDTTGSKNDSPV